MHKKTALPILLTSIIIILTGVLSLAAADDGEKGKHRERRRERHRDAERYEVYLKQVDNPTYEKECGGCHFVYQPGLLPSASWTKILANLDDHFGETIEMDVDSKKVISDYLRSNSAEYSSAKCAVKIMRSLGNRVPLRITDIPYIREKHHDISQSTLKRESIGSLSNCAACHTTAERGVYEDDDVRIPK